MSSDLLTYARCGLHTPLHKKETNKQMQIDSRSGFSNIQLNMDQFNFLFLSFETVSYVVQTSL